MSCVMSCTRTSSTKPPFYLPEAYNEKSETKLLQLEVTFKCLWYQHRLKLKAFSYPIIALLLVPEWAKVEAELHG